MASDGKLREQIAKIVGGSENARFEDIEWVMNRLGATSRKTKHTHMFKLYGRRLMINRHSNGKATLPKYCVDDFRDLMIELGLY